MPIERRTSFAKTIFPEALALICLSLFVSAIAAWASIIEAMVR